MRVANHSVPYMMLAVSFIMSPFSVHAATPVNSVNDGRVIQGGTYYNTVGGKTTFINRQSGGLWLKAGNTVRGLETDANGALNSNGGTLHLYAPDNVVRVDGNINVNAIRYNQGAYLGNGGRVFIDSAYLFQNGNVLANGVNGGLVQFNVGGMTLGVGAQIQARGSTGAGGTVAINSAGPVDLRRNSSINTSGKVLGSLDGNLINIEGGLVNNDGSLRADGVNSRGGSIRLVAGGQSPYQEIKNTLQAATVNPPGDTSAPTVSESERTFLLQRTRGLIDNREGQVFLSRDTSSVTPSYISNLTANGTGGNPDPQNDYSQNPASRAGDGGNITLVAMQGIHNLGNIVAVGAHGNSGENPVNAGNGGTITVLSQSHITNSGPMETSIEASGGVGGASTGANTGGKGGDGGLIAFGYNGTLTNTGGILANGSVGGNGTNPGSGGNGGLVVFSGNGNPVGNGIIETIGRPGGGGNLFLGGKAGTIVSPDPNTLGQTQAYFQQGYDNGQPVSNLATQQTQPVELLTHGENLVLLTKNGGNSTISENLFVRLTQARIRSVEDPTGALGQARQEIFDKNTASSPYVYRNLLLSSSRNNLEMHLNHPYKVEFVGGAPGELIFPSVLSRGEGFTTLNTLTLLNNGGVRTQYLPGPYNESGYQATAFWIIGRNSNSTAGGRISALANGRVINQNYWGTAGTISGGSVHIATSDTFVNSAALFTTGWRTPTLLHGGSLTMRAGENVVNAQGLYDPTGAMRANGELGGTIRILANNDFEYPGAFSYNASIEANGRLHGGIIQINAGHDSIVDFEPFNIELPPVITANGTSADLGRGGFVHIHAGNNNIHNGTIEATGGLEDGTVLFTTGN